MSRILLLSVRPKYAESILAGLKTVELRRVRPAIAAGDKLLLYVSSPTQALVAETIVTCVSSGRPDNLWMDIESKAGITHSEFEAYFRGAQQATAIHLSDLRQFHRPISLTRLREFWHGFRAPQLYQYVTQDQMLILLALAKSEWQEQEMDGIKTQKPFGHLSQSDAYGSSPHKFLPIPLLAPE